MTKAMLISLLTLLLAGCTGTPAPVRTAGVYAFIEPVTGRTYNLPVRALRESIAQTRGGSVPEVGVHVGAVAHVNLPGSATLVEPFAAKAPATQGGTVRSSRVAQDAAPALKLRLDEEFASFTLKRESLKTT